MYVCVCRRRRRFSLYISRTRGPWALFSARESTLITSFIHLCVNLESSLLPRIYLISPIPAAAGRIKGLTGINPLYGGTLSSPLRSVFYDPPSITTPPAKIFTPVVESPKRNRFYIVVFILRTVFYAVDSSREREKVIIILLYIMKSGEKSGK